MDKNICIEEYIPNGHDNAVTVSHLQNILGMSNRDIRAHIEAARDHGICIINMMDGRGYFKPNTDEYDLVMHWHMSQRSREAHIRSGRRSSAQWLRENEKENA